MSHQIHRIGANIKRIREAYGESQLDLAQAIGVDSPGTISMLESGMRGRNRYTMIEKIARHYNISENTLFYQESGQEDGFAMDFVSLPIDAPEQTRTLFSTVLPLVFSSTALESAAFQNAYTLHKEAETEMKSHPHFPENTFSRCLELYDISIKEETIPEAAANSLWWILVCGLFHCYPKIFIGLQKLEQHIISKQAFYKDWYLSDSSDESFLQQKERKRDYLKRYRRQIHDLISRLYASLGYSLAEYYTALFYIAGLAEGGWRIGESRLIGGCMISSLSDMGNRYAAAYMEALAAFHNM